MEDCGSLEKVCFGLRLTVRTVAVDMEDLGSDGLVRRVEGGAQDWIGTSLPRQKIRKDNQRARFAAYFIEPCYKDR